MAGLFELIDKLIREHGSASIMKDLLELVREQAKADMADLKRQHASEVAELNQKVAELESGERCPFCREPAELLDFVPHEEPDLEYLGKKQRLYRCTVCTSEFRKPNT